MPQVHGRHEECCPSHKGQDQWSDAKVAFQLWLTFLSSGHLSLRCPWPVTSSFMWCWKCFNPLGHFCLTHKPERISKEETNKIVLERETWESISPRAYGICPAPCERSEHYYVPAFHHCSELEKTDLRIIGKLNDWTKSSLISRMTLKWHYGWDQPYVYVCVYICIHTPTHTAGNFRDSIPKFWLSIY